MRKRGFTLIELLIIVTAVAVLFALLTPAIQRSRQDAQRTRCKNNMKQLALAMHNYHDVFAVFPPGWVSKEGAAGEGPRFGWMSMLLPYMDQAPLYNALSREFGREMPATPHQDLQKSIEQYLCPSDTTPATNPLRGDYGTSNYAGCYGEEPFPRWLPAGLSDTWPGSVEAPMKSTGTFARNSSVRIRDYRDGTSNTFFIGERCFTSGSGIWPGVTDNAHEDDTLATTSHRSRPNTGPSSFSSRHGRMVHIGMCDGAVRAIDQNIDSQAPPERGTWQRLGNKSDGEPIGEF